MYTVEAAPQPGPGTELIERWTGLASYFGTPSYFMTPAGQEGIRGMGYYEQRTAPQPGPGTQLVERWTGMGCGLGCNKGMGGLTMDGSGIFGTGIFGTGVTMSDVSTWGPGEWAVVALGAYTLFSLVNDLKRGGAAVGRKAKAVSRAARA
jgi:hypothetical protein